MFEPDDRELDDFLEGRSGISRTYAEGKRETSPSSADAAIRALAREDLRRAAHGGWRRMRLLRPLALAACMVLALGVLLQLRNEPEMREALPVPAPQALPETVPMIPVQPLERSEAPSSSADEARAKIAREAEDSAAPAPSVQAPAPSAEPTVQAAEPAPVAPSPEIAAPKDRAVEAERKAMEAPRKRETPSLAVPRPAPAPKPLLDSRRPDAAAGASQGPAQDSASQPGTAPAAPAVAPSAREPAREAAPRALGSERRGEPSSRPAENDFFVAPEERAPQLAPQATQTTSDARLDEIRAMASNNPPAARTALRAWQAANPQAQVPEDLAWLLP